MKQINSAILPVDDDETDHCPECGKDEDTVMVCKHCGYKYPENEDDCSALGMFVGIMLTLTVAWLFITIMCWLIGQTVNGHSTLVEFFHGQWQFVKALRIW